MATTTITFFRQLGSSIWLAFLLPLRETRLPIERLAEIRGRASAAAAPPPSGATARM